MKRLGLFSLILSAVVLGPSAQGQLIDDFNAAGLGEYTQTRVLDNAIGQANVSFSDATGALVSSYGGTTNQAEQVLLLRSDFNLAVGNALLVDTLFLPQLSQMDFGIAVSATGTPIGASIADSDTRDTFNWAAVYVRPSQDAVRTTTSIGGSVVTGTGVLGANETIVSYLFIERNSATDFTLGYIDSSANRFVSQSITFGASDVGTAIGIYADLRAAGGSLGSLDNLRITAIPEPATGALMGLGVLAVILSRRRRA